MFSVARAQPKVIWAVERLWRQTFTDVLAHLGKKKKEE
jgi:hypothetical protein